MSSLTPTTHLVTPQPPLDPKAHWITHADQLKRLALPIAEKVFEGSALIFDLAELVAGYALDKSFYKWRWGLARLRSLPDKIPPLPNNVYEIMHTRCPIYGNTVKDDGEPYLVKDTHFLSLIPEEFGSLNRMIENVLKPYEERNRTYRQQDVRPLNPEFTVTAICKEHGDVPFSATHFVLMTQDILPDSRAKSWDEQVTLVDKLSEKASVLYEVPTLHQSITVAITNIVINKKINHSFDGEKSITNQTRVKEVTDGRHLTVRGFSSGFVRVSSLSNSLPASVGIVALRKL